MQNLKNLVESLSRNQWRTIRNKAITIVGLAAVIFTTQSLLTLGEYWFSSRYPPQWIEKRIVAIEKQEPSFSYPPGAPVPPHGYRAYFDGMDKPIFFESGNWDSSANIGDIVTIVYKKGFFGSDLEGLFITDYK